MLVQVWKKAKKENWRRLDADGVSMSWADTEEADILRAAIKLMQAQEKCREKFSQARASQEIKKTVHEMVDLENWLLHKARVMKYGPNIKRRKREYA